LGPRTGRAFPSTRGATGGLRQGAVGIDEVWDRIERASGEPFQQIRGAEFTYEVVGNSLLPDRTNRQLSKSQFEQALELVPLENHDGRTTSAGSFLHLRDPDGPENPDDRLVVRKADFEALPREERGNWDRLTYVALPLSRQ
jgi:hypothetical protein